jgi:uncharacterized HAD superfamily protein
MIVLDIDGVVANYFEELDFSLQQAGYPEHHWENWAGYSWKDIYPNIPREEIDSFLHDPMIAKNCKAFEDAWYWINHYSSIYDIMYLTARDSTLSDVTWEWFREWDIPVDFIVFEKNKVEFLTQIQPTIYVDDHPDMVKLANDAGINSFLYNRSYNSNYKIDDSLRINSLWDIKCV